jgi:hypothetical protein
MLAEDEGPHFILEQLGFFRRLLGSEVDMMQDNLSYISVPPILFALKLKCKSLHRYGSNLCDFVSNTQFFNGMESRPNLDIFII